jgi:dTDP-4-amino-4,6-dideoxygalactose transaminase
VIKVSFIPYSRTFTGKKAMHYLQNVVDTGLLVGEGKYTHLSEEILSRITTNQNTLLTPSCTDALEMASMLMGLKPGDEVILPSFTFTSAAIAVTKFGATPIFVDINDRDLNINTNSVLEAVTPKTKAISYVNYAGFGASVEGLMDELKGSGIYVVEDNAHGFGGEFDGKKLGLTGDFGVHSFHGTKNIQCGEGGSIQFSDANFIDQAHVLRQKGTNRRDFIDGRVNKYSWVGSGSSFLASELQAAVLFSQLEEYDLIQEKRYKIWNMYAEGITETETFRKPPRESRYAHTAHIFYLRLQSFDRRKKFIEHMQKHEIQVSSHYEALHRSSAAKKYGANENACPIATNVSDTLIRLPIWVEMSINEIERVIEATNSFQK